MIFVTRKTVSQIELNNPGNGEVPYSGRGHQEENQTDSENLVKITHDIRGSINVIIGYAQLMLDQTTGKINSQQRQALQDILNSSNKLSNLTDIIFKRLDTESEKK